MSQSIPPDRNARGERMRSAAMTGRVGGAALAPRVGKTQVRRVSGQRQYDQGLPAEQLEDQPNHAGEEREYQEKRERVHWVLSHSTAVKPSPMSGSAHERVVDVSRREIVGSGRFAEPGVPRVGDPHPHVRKVVPRRALRIAQTGEPPGTAPTPVVGARIGVGDLGCSHQVRRQAAL